MMASLGKLKRSEKSTHRKTHKTGNREFQKMAQSPRFHTTVVDRSERGVRGQAVVTK